MTTPNDRTVLGPWGNNQGFLDVSPPCYDGYNGYIVTYGVFVGQIRFICGTANNTSLSHSIGLVLSLGSGTTQSKSLFQNQNLVGFHMYYDSSGIRAMHMLYADFPRTSRCYNALGHSTGRCPTLLLVVVVRGILRYKYRVHHKKEFQGHDVILPLR